MMLFRQRFSLIFLVLLLGLFSCTSNKQKSLLINGAGASFPYILYSKWLTEYKKIKTDVTINYQSIGSGGGVRQFLTGSLDFGGTDVPVSKKEKKRDQIVHIPTTLGAVAVTYKLETNEQALNFDGEVLSGIFQGKITKWNDERIQKLNPGVPLKEQDIVPIYRADGSGTTSFFTEYLSKSSSDFLKNVGHGKSVAWPVGVGGKGNEGVMGLVNKIDGAIAYIGLSYAISQKLPMAKLKNKAGVFISPNPQSIKATASYAAKKGLLQTESLIFVGGKNSYPISGFTYIIVGKKMPKTKGEKIIDFLKWSLGDGQGYAPPLHFVPLPGEVVMTSLRKLNQIEFE